MQKNEIIIELTETVTKKLVDEGSVHFDYDHTIYNEFEIKAPANCFYNVDLVKENIMKTSNVKAKDLDKLDENWTLSLNVTFKPDTLKLKVVDSKLKMCTLETSLNKYIPLPLASFSIYDDSEQTFFATLKFLKVISGVLFNLDSSNYTVVENKLITKEIPKKKGKKGKKSNNNKVKYINYRRYVMNTVSSEFTNPKERNYTKDSWQVKGFWATARNGKKYWRKPSIRKRKVGKVDNKTNSETLIKMTKTIK